MNAVAFLGMDEEQMLMLRFERGWAWLQVMGFTEAQRVALHQDPEFWQWWNNLWKYRLIAFIKANHLLPMPERRPAWADWMKQEFKTMIPVKLKRRIAQCA